MKTKLLVLLFLLSLSTHAQSLFQKIVGGNLGDNIVIATTPNAYYLLHNISTPDFASELLKFDLNGNLQWGRTYFFSFGAANSYRIRYENNALYITGGMQHNGYKNFYAKLDLAGNITWIKELDYNDININARLLAFNGGNLLVGHRDYLGTASDYTYDITLAAMDASGNLSWARAYGDDTSDYIANTAVVTPNGEIMVAGSHGSRNTNTFSAILARFDATGNLLWMKTLSDMSGLFPSFRPTDLINTSDGNFAVIGFSHTSGSDFDVQLIKFDAQGNILWAKRPYQPATNEFGKSILEDSQHNIVIGGNYNASGLYGDFIGKFDLGGNYISAVKIEKTLDSPFLFIPVFNCLGEDLYEQPGLGYVYSTVFTTANFSYRHCLVTTDYGGYISCTSLTNGYPFTIQNVSWTESNVAVLPSYLTNITVGNSNIYDSAKTYQATNICLLVTGAGAEPQENLTMEVFPNPASGVINLQVSPARGGTIRWALYNTTGEPVSSGVKSSGDAGTLIKIETGNFAPGLYYLKVDAGKEQRVEKILIR